MRLPSTIPAGRMLPKDDCRMSLSVRSFPEGTLSIAEMGDGRRRLRAEPVGDGVYIQNPTCVTRYPVELIEMITAHKSVLWVCDEIVREENPRAVRWKLERGLLGYLRPEEFAGARILDFGCGCGASTMNLARLFPEARLVGIELNGDSLAIARARAAFYGYRTVELHRSPGATRLPPDLGRFDHIVLNAVYEHLLPRERKLLLPLLWDRLRPGGVLFVCETPYRRALFECHTTGLPLINYLPDWLALRAARALSSRVLRCCTWEKLLRDGVRGGSPAEILRMVRRCEGRAALLRPDGTLLEEPLEAWPTSLDKLADSYRAPLRDRFGLPKALMDRGLRRASSHLGIPLAADLMIAVRKELGSW